MEPDTIVAVATPRGVGGVSVVRISGPDAGGVLAAVAPGLPGPPAPRRATLARIVDAGGRLVDRALVTRFPAPGSYTGEDVVEISGHGGWLAPERVVEACVAAGCRRAAPGEFTRRAYLNGRMDLVQAEAVADLVEGRSVALQDAALGQLERGLSRRVAELRGRIIEVEALLVHHLDFPDEDEPPTPLEAIAGEADGVVDALDRLLATAPGGELLREGALTVLAGRPNSGKSSLFNALVGRERAIVTPEPGTTRDALEAVVSLDGYPFRLVDTAGLREEAEGVERLGIEVAERYVRAAHLVLLCVEAEREAGAAEAAFLRSVSGTPVVLLRTKADRAPEAGDGPGGVRSSPRVSVETGEGLDDLRRELPRLVYRGLVEGGSEAPVLTRARQTRLARGARDEVRAFTAALRRGVPPEVASAHLKAAASGLEELVGGIGSDEVLDRVFSRFCVGK